MQDNPEKVYAQIVGRKINGLFLSEGERLLKFDTDNGVKYFHAVGDCCSESWFDTIIGVDALVGHTVREVVTLDLPDAFVPKSKRPTRQDSDICYGFRIVTEAGECEVIFRNSSNGYYGGWLTFGDHGQYGPYSKGRAAMIEKENKFYPVTQDR